jgi:tetratricopeptide (TPR) repeat protein
MDPMQLQLAMTRHRAGRLLEAEALYKEWLAANPGQATGLNCYGVLAIQTGRIDLAVALLERAVYANPADAHYHCNLGEARRQSSRLGPAVESFREAIRLMPGLAVAHNNLGIALAAMKDWQGAITSYTSAIRLQFDYAEAHGNLGNALKEAGRLEDAIAECRMAVSLKPENAEMHNQLGAALAEMGEIDEAIGEYKIAIRIDSKHAEAHTNLGNALAAQGRVQDAVASCETAVRLRPDSIPAHWNFAVALLRSGDYERGWVEHEWRLRTPNPANRPRFRSPAWNGQPLAGKTILLHAEQGFGDTIQFVRYVPMVAAREGRVIVECHRELVRLFVDCPAVVRVIAFGEVLPAFDQHVPLMSLPRIFGTQLASVPASVSYLRSNPVLLRNWRERLAANVLHVGLCWYGNARHRNDRERSIPLGDLAALATEGVVFHSLQTEPAGVAPPVMQLIDHSRELSDFAETAALIENLDYVISVDTAVAHLAGAMGIATAVLLPMVPDWRWMLHRQESAWYPTVRLYRQKRMGKWGEVVQQVAKDVSRQAKSRDFVRV